MATDKSPRPKLLETNFGLLVLASSILLTALLEGGGSFGFGIGMAAGRFFASVAIALPIFIVLRYATTTGRTWAARAALGMACLVTATIVVLLALLSAFVPNAISQLRRETTSNHQAPASTTQPSPKDTGQASKAVGADLPVCKNYFDQYDFTPPKCKPKL